jgi:DNA ligase-1
MKLFAPLYHQLDISTKPGDKVAAMTRYFEQADDRDKVWMIALFCGKRPVRSISVSQLRLWAVESSTLPEWLFKASLEVTKDWAETIASILPEPSMPSPISLADCMEMIISLREKEAAEKKSKVLAIWATLTGQERWIVNKLLTGGFRPGASQKQMILALSQQSNLAKNSIYLRLKEEWNPKTHTFQQLLYGENTQDKISNPFPFQLPDIREVIPEKCGIPADWLVEWKWQGVRSQVIRRDDAMFIWNRAGELISEKFPEFEPFLQQLPGGTVIDGEILGWKEGVPLSRGVLQNRLSRKSVSKKLLKEVPAHFIAFDLLEYEGKDMRHHPLTKRRELLEIVVKKAGLAATLSLSEQIECEAWDQLAELRKYARDYHTQGFVLKPWNSPYVSGRNGLWQKWEADLITIKGVLIYAEREARRSSNKYASFTFAVWKDEELIPFAKADSELPETEIQELENWVQAHTRERFGPVRAVVAQLVFEIGFEGIERSTRRKSGVSLLAPRIIAWQREVSAESADSLERLEELVARYG